MVITAKWTRELVHKIFCSRWKANYFPWEQPISLMEIYKNRKLYANTVNFIGMKCKLGTCRNWCLVLGLLAVFKMGTIDVRKHSCTTHYSNIFQNQLQTPTVSLIAFQIAGHTKYLEENHPSLKINKVIIISLDIFSIILWTIFYKCVINGKLAIWLLSNQSIIVSS